MTGPEKIRAAGWRQGSVIERQSASENLQRCLGGWPAELTHCLVLSQDCDILNRDYAKEPEVELLGCRVIGAANGAVTQGKNPRQIHLLATITGNTQVLDAQVCHRKFVPRSLLEDFAPAANCRLSVEQTRTLADWVARRYTRSAFPDEFNRRLEESKIGIKRVLTDNGAVISGVWIALNTEAELSAGEFYRVGLRVVMAVADYEDTVKRDQGQRVVNALEIALQHCAGIEVERADLVSERDFSLDDLHYLLRFDSYDYLSNVDE